MHRCAFSPQALSPVGRCKSFEASADGYGRGEGFVAALLTQTQPGQPAMAIMCGTAVNQDGRSSGLTAPNGPSQTKLLLKALRQAGGPLGLPGLVAVHGTGTPLGDPIEVGALGQAGSSMGSSSTSGFSSPQPVVLASVKSCYGHTEGAAGLTGLLLATMAATQQRSTPVMHLRSTNPYVEAALADWRKSGPWAAAIPRQQQAAQQAAQLASTSSFGMSGVNAHALLSAPGEQALQAAASDSTAVMQQQLQRQRVWPLPPMHPLLHMAAALQQQAMVGCTLARPHLAYLQQQLLSGRATLPAAAVLELMAASGQVLSDSLARVAVAEAALAMPIEWAKGTVLSCSIQLGHGAVQVTVGGSKPVASGQLVQLATAPRMGISASSSSSVSSAQRALLLNGRQPLHSKQQCSLAVVAAPALDPQASGYSCHPSIAEAGISLGGLPSAACVLQGCAVYAPGQHQVGALAATATRTAAAIGAGGGNTALQVQGMMARTAAVAMEAHSAAAAATSPAWQLLWQAVDLQTNPQPQKGATTALVISTQPWPLTQLCADPDGKQNSRQPLVAVNAVWGGNSAAPGGSSRLPSTIPELCFSNAAHLDLLLQSTQPQQCLFVQPPGQAVDAAAALATFTAVARSQANTRLSLVTYDQQMNDAFTVRPQADAGPLLGKL